jgi:hypothetical protein
MPAGRLAAPVQHAAAAHKSRARVLAMGLQVVGAVADVLRHAPPPVAGAAGLGNHRYWLHCSRHHDSVGGLGQAAE